MLFLYRPRETWMPFARPMSGTQQAAYNRQLQAKFESTRRAPGRAAAGLAQRPLGAAPASARASTGARDPVTALKELGALHQAGQLTDAEFEQAKAMVLGQ